MNKKLISLLVAICLVIGLLPVASIAADPEPATAKVAIGKTANVMEVTEGGAAAYGKSVAFDGTKQNGTAIGTGWEYTTAGASATDWNFKFVYPQGGVPTLTLKDAKLINTDANGNVMYKDGTSTGTWTGIMSRNEVHDLKVVLQGENEILVGNGIIRGAFTDANKFSSITIVGESGGSLTANGKQMGIQGKFGVPITIENATLNLTPNSTTAAAAPIYTEDANITIKNSTINVTSEKNSVKAIHAEGTGVITVNNSALELTTLGTAFNKAPVLSAGFVAVAGDDAATAVAVTDAAALATAKYVKVTYPAPAPSTESTSAPTSAPTDNTSAPTDATGAALPTEYVLQLADHDGTTLTAYTLTNYDTPVYSVNTTLSGYFTKADFDNEVTENKRDYITQRAGTENNWNAKLVWHTGDEGPTLYLDGFKFDTYNNEMGGWLRRGTSVDFYHCAISTGSTAPLKIVLQGEDSYIRNYHGIHYQNKLSIESEGNTKLTMFTRNSGIIPSNDVANLYDPTGTYNDVIGYSLTLNANLDINTYANTGDKTDTKVTDGTYAVEDWNFGTVSTREADLIINGGNISIKSAGPTGTANLTGPFGMKAKVSGNIIVNGGNLTVEAGYRGVQVWPDYDMIINGGTVAIGVSSSGYYALYKSTKLSTASEYAAPVLPEGGSYKLWQGNNADTATEVTSLTGNKKYFKVEVLSGAPDASTPTGTSAPTGTSTPTETTGAPTSATGGSATSAPTSATAPAWTMTAPAVTTTQPTKPASAPASAVVTLWGTAVTLDETNTAYYWVNGAEGANPVAATATDNWNYAFQIIDNVPTVTLRNASYSGTASFLTAAFDGNLRVAYEGTNNIVVPANTSEGRYFISYASSTNSAGKGHLFIAGADDAVLNVTGGSTKSVMMSVSKKAYITIYGGTVNMEKTCSGGYGVIGAGYSKTTIQDCTLNVKQLTVSADYHPTVTLGYSSYGVTITNANVNIESAAHTALCAGVFQSNMNGVLYAATVTVNGSSTVRIVNDTEAERTEAYNGVGLYASKLTVKGGNLLVEGNKQAVYGTVDVDSYDGQFNMYTEKGGQAVGQYTATPYFMIAYTDAPAPTVPPTSAPTTAPTSAPTTTPTTLPTNSTNPQDYTLVIQGSNFRLPGYDTPIYLVNAEVDGYYRENVTVPVTDPTTGAEVTDPTTGAVVTETKTQLTTKKYNTLVKDGADETNYNAKLVWHTGDEGPTLYLKSAVMDDYNEDLRQWRRTSADKANTNAAMHTDKDAPLKIVLESGESIMKGYAGLQYQNQLTIESVGDASLYLWGNNVGLVPSSVGSQYAGNGFIYGYDLILNANLTVSQQSWSNATHSGAIIRAMGADIYIKGGKIVTEYNGAAKSCKGIKIEGSGNLYVEGGYIYSESYNSANHTEAAVEVAGNIYVSGGEVEAIAGSQSGLKATNIYITGGIVKTRVNYTSLLVPEETGVISFTGGMLDIQGSKVAAYNDTTKSEKEKALVLKDGGTLQGWVGPNPYTLTPYAGEFKTYNKLAYEPVEANVMPTPVPGGDIPLKTTVTLGGDGSKQITLELTKYDADVFYTVNKAVESVDTEGNPYTRWIQTTEGADENNWNAKFIWHSTDSAPTLYLKGFKFDYWNEETSKYDAVPKTTTPANNTAINTGSAVPMIIKLTGEDSVIEARFGIHYNNHLTILSEGDTKLTMNNQYSNVSSVNAAGFTLTVDANLDLSIRSLYNSTYSGGALMNKGDIIVNGGNIVTNNEVENSKDVNGIVARGEAGTDEAGDLIINGGNITVVGANGQGHRNGALQANGMLIINGGVINASAKKAVGMNGYLGVEINGGEINVISPWYGVTSGYSYRDENNALKHVLKPIAINGGTLTIMAERSFYGGTTVTIGEGVMAYAGAGKRNAEVYDGTDGKLISKPWFFSTDDESKFLVIEEDEDEDLEDIITAPTAPTTTDGTGAPSDATGVPGVSDPTGATGPNGYAPDVENPDEENPEEEYWDSNIYVDYVEGDMDVIPDALIDIGLDSVDAIWEALLEMMWNVDENINRVSFFDAVPWFYDGEEWIFADEEHLPEDGYVTVMLPYPEGTDFDTDFTALHMFTTDTFGMTPGDVELLMPVYTEDGIELELTGLSPVMLGWVDYDDTDDNHATGDTDVAMFFALMLFSVLGMATVVLLNKKRAV